MDTNTQQLKRVELIFGFYEKHGNEDYIGEPVSQLEHMCQSAQLAEEEGFDEEVILAAFFHDLGHLITQGPTTEMMGEFGVKRHEQLGADFLRSLGFSEKIAQLVENHVQAKRYLTFRYPDYYTKLSEASKQTLIYQGGPMKEEEALKFEKDPLFEVSLRMRTWDEEAKLTDQPLPSLTRYKEMALKALENSMN
ncbi:MAG: HDIG domain-containing protein [Algoriphagus sp.]|nr:HDIG domain-containing protein [Algoriphagus sp.]